MLFSKAAAKQWEDSLQSAPVGGVGGCSGYRPSPLLESNIELGLPPRAAGCSRTSPPITSALSIMMELSLFIARRKHKKNPYLLTDPIWIGLECDQPL